MPLQTPQCGSGTNKEGRIRETDESLHAQCLCEAGWSWQGQGEGWAGSDHHFPACQDCAWPALCLPTPSLAFLAEPPPLLPASRPFPSSQSLAQTAVFLRPPLLMGRRDERSPRACSAPCRPAASALQEPPATQAALAERTLGGFPGLGNGRPHSRTARLASEAARCPRVAENAPVWPQAAISSCSFFPGTRSSEDLKGSEFKLVGVRRSREEKDHHPHPTPPASLPHRKRGGRGARARALCWPRRRQAWLLQFTCPAHTRGRSLIHRNKKTQHFISFQPS